MGIGRLQWGWEIDMGRVEGGNGDHALGVGMRGDSNKRVRLEENHEPPISRVRLPAGKSRLMF